MVKTIFLRMSTQPQLLNSIVLTASVFFAAFLFFFFNLWFLSSVTFAEWSKDVIFASDTPTIVNRLEGEQETFKGGMWRKHPLFTLTVYPLVQALQWVPLLDQ